MMSVHGITLRVSRVLSETAHEVAARRCSRELQACDILFSVAIGYPGESAVASRILGVTYRDLMFSVLPQMGAFVTSVPTKGQLIPGIEGNKILETALWCAETRGAEICGLGDLFYASCYQSLGDLLPGSAFDLDGDRVGSLWILAEAFGERSTAEKQTDEYFEKS